MSRLSELIRDLCPDGVEYRSLAEVGTFVRGGGLQKSDFVDEGLPCVHYGQIHTRFGVSVTQALTYVSETQFVRLKHAYHGDLLIVTTSEDDAAVGKATAWLGNSEVAISGDMSYYRHSLDPKYVSYFFASHLFQGQKRPYLTGAKVRRISNKGLSNIRIPVPPIEVQQEIVRILDQFTTLEAELEAELEARRKQYEHYRDSFLSFHPGDRSVRWVSIGDASDVFGGLTGKRKGDFGVGEARYASYRNVYSNIALDVDPEDRVRIRPDENQRRLLLGDLILTGSSESRDEVGMSSVVVDQPPHDLYLNSFCIGVRWRNPEAYYPDFVKHLFRSGAMRKLISCSADGVTRFNLSKRKLKKLVIPVPLIEEQRRIADILDRFDALVNDISSGLPAEIAARRKQYEHYRDRLLSFPEKEA